MDMVGSGPSGGNNVRHVSKDWTFGSKGGFFLFPLRLRVAGASAGTEGYEGGLHPCPCSASGSVVWGWGGWLVHRRVA